MNSHWNSKIVGIYYDNLPHWVVDYGCYSITLRCYGNYPKELVKRIRAICETAKRDNTESAESLELNRKLFKLLELYDDVGGGFAPFADSGNAEVLFRVLTNESSITDILAHFVIMPNHVHLLTKPLDFSSVEKFQTVFQGLKKKTAYEMNRCMGRSGQFWQKSWYDRWIRSEHEYGKWVEYLNNNPLKAELCKDPLDYPWKSS